MFSSGSAVIQHRVLLVAPGDAHVVELVDGKEQRAVGREGAGDARDESAVEADIV